MSFAENGPGVYTSFGPTPPLKTNTFDLRNNMINYEFVSYRQTTYEFGELITTCSTSMYNGTISLCSWLLHLTTLRLTGSQSTSLRMIRETLARKAVCSTLCVSRTCMKPHTFICKVLKNYPLKNRITSPQSIMAAYCVVSHIATTNNISLTVTTTVNITSYGQIDDGVCAFEEPIR
ncbi:hypothetical protein AO442_003854 [Nakaseomyces glabratus]|nr:hypothetical protein AO442_003854 [Nakaseomyces glabratus]